MDLEEKLSEISPWRQEDSPSGGWSMLHTPCGEPQRLLVSHYRNLMLPLDWQYLFQSALNWPERHQSSSLVHSRLVLFQLLSWNALQRLPSFDSASPQYQHSIAPLHCWHTPRQNHERQKWMMPKPWTHTQRAGYCQSILFSIHKGPAWWGTTRCTVYKVEALERQ